MAVDFNSPGFFKLVAQGYWPPGDEAQDAFLDLHREDVQTIVKWTLRRSPRGRTWESLHHLMEHKGYVHVRELGPEAAVAWARHLGISHASGIPDHRYEPSVGA